MAAKGKGRNTGKNTGEKSGADTATEEPLTGSRYLVAGTFRRMVGLAQLEQRIQALEEEIVVHRSAHVRLAELIDLVQELLLPAVSRDDEKVARLLDKFAEELGD